MQIYRSSGYSFKFNIQTKSNIAIYKPGEKNALSSITGPEKNTEYNYRIECEKWLYDKEIKSEEDYSSAVSALWLKYEL